MIIALREGRGLLTQRNSLRNVNTKTYTESRCKQKKSPRPWDVKVTFLHLVLVSSSLAEDAIHMEEGLERGTWATRAKGEGVVWGESISTTSIISWWQIHNHCSGLQVLDGRGRHSSPFTFYSAHSSPEKGQLKPLDWLSNIMSLTAPSETLSK